MLFKNVASQKIHVYAYNSTTGAAKTGDAANITAYVSLDGTANAVDDTNPAEVDATNMPGIYVFDLTQAETNCNSFALSAKSATADIRIEPIIGFTTGPAVTQTGDSYPIVSSGTHGNAALKTLIDNVDDFVDTEIGALTTELAKVPKSDSNVTWNATALASINAEVDTALNTAIPGSPTADSINERIATMDGLAGGASGFEAIKTQTAAIETDTQDLQTQIADIPTVTEMNARTKPTADYFDPAADTVAHVTLVDTTTTNTDMRGTDNAATAAVCTEARLSELDAGTAGKAAHQIDIIQTDTTTDIPALIGALPSAAAVKTAMEAAGSHLTLIKAVTDALTSAAAGKLAASAGTIVTGTVEAGTLSTTQATTDLTLTDADQLNGRVIIFRNDTTTAGLRYQATAITDFVAAGGLLTYTAITQSPQAGDTFVVV